MIGNLQLTIGTGGDQVFRTGGEKPATLARIARPTFLTRIRNHTYGVSEIGHGKIFRAGNEPALGMGAAIPIGGLDRKPIETGHIGEPISSGGAHPCHITSSPDGAWLYVCNYGDGLVRAVGLEPDGGFAEVVDLAHRGRGPDPVRQTGPHAHFAAVVEDWLVVTDLGTDELRIYHLDAGRPNGSATVVRMPAGSGPRHFARLENRLVVAGELDGSLTSVEIGTWKVGHTVAASQAAGARQLSHILVAQDHVVVGVRGANTLAVLTPSLTRVSETRTVRWPRHFAYAVTHNRAGIVVAGERGNEVGWHDFDDGMLDDLGETLRVPEPMFIGIGEEF